MKIMKYLFAFLEFKEKSWQLKSKEKGKWLATFIEFFLKTL